MSSKSIPSFFKWYFLVIYLAVLCIILLTFFSDVFRTGEPGSMPDIVWLITGAMLLFALIIVLAKIIKLAELIEDNGIKLEKIAEAQEENRLVLAEIRQSLPETPAARRRPFQAHALWRHSTVKRRLGITPPTPGRRGAGSPSQG